MKKIAILFSLACTFMSGNAAAATYNFSCSIGYPTKLAEFKASVDGMRIGNKVTAYLTVPSYSYLTASNFKVSGQAFVNNNLTTTEFTAYFNILGVRGDIITLGMVAKDRSKISCQLI